MSASKIEWTDRVWNPVRGCARVSPGCENCYAERQAHRFSGKGGAYEGLTVLGKHGPRWAGRARFVPEMLGAPLRWASPQRVFVNSMSDLFHEDITAEQIASVFGVMAACPQHTFQILTKRPERMLWWFRWADQWTVIPCSHAHPWLACAGRDERIFLDLRRSGGLPLQNVWLGVSCEDQSRANERIPLLLRIPAAARFVSAEPLLGPINFHVSTGGIGRDALRVVDEVMGVRERHLDWVIIGGESGPGARPCDIVWVGSVVKQCKAASVPCFVKQLGARAYDGAEGVRCDGQPHEWAWLSEQGMSDRKGSNPSEWPADLRVREFPGARP